MKDSIRKALEYRKERIAKRLKGEFLPPELWERPFFNAAGVKYELSRKTRVMAYGGIGLLHRVAEAAGVLAPGIEERGGGGVQVSSAGLQKGRTA